MLMKQFLYCEKEKCIKMLVENTVLQNFHYLYLFIRCRIILNRFMFEDYTGIRDKPILMIKGE